MASSLTTVAAHIANYGTTLAEASTIVCQNLLPCVPCSLSSSQACNTQLNCLDVCVKNTLPISVFSFDALLEYILSNSDPAWASWLAGQLNTAYSIQCAGSALRCASALSCGPICTQPCLEQGLIVGNYSVTEVADALYNTLALMTTQGRVALEDSTGNAIYDLINITANALNQSHRNARLLSTTCSQTNEQTYSVLVSSSGRRLARAHASMDHRAHAARTLEHAIALTKQCGTKKHVGMDIEDVRPACSVRLGCRRLGAINFDSTATVDIGQCILFGCMDTNSFNYDLMATHHDAKACVSKIYGCTFPVASNLDTLANTDDGSCRFDLPGCTDSRASNFLSSAATDDGSCMHHVLGCTDASAINFASTATVNTACVYFTPPTSERVRRWPNINQILQDGSAIAGCTKRNSLNYDSLATADDGRCVAHRQGCMQGEAINFDSLANVDLPGSTCRFATPGCTNSFCLNFDEAAAVDDGSCVCNGCTFGEETRLNHSWASSHHFTVLYDGSCPWPKPGCTRPIALNYESEATKDGGSCAIQGCTNVSALNFNSVATFDDGSCQLPVIIGCTHSEAINYLSAAQVSDQSCRFAGCMSTAAMNFHTHATFHVPPMCVLPSQGCLDSLADNFVSSAQLDDRSCVRTGCMESHAINFDSSATAHSHHCIHAQFGCLNSHALNYRSDSLLHGGHCILLGCTDSTAQNYDTLATTDDSSCSKQISGCLDSNAENYFSEANRGGKNCAFPGCTNSAFSRYDPNANVDDGSCPPVQYGCMDSSAANFMPYANARDDLSCVHLGCASIDHTSYNTSFVSRGDCPIQLTGCADSTAPNFMSVVSSDDGSCYRTGCTNSEAANFDPLANANDGSCLLSLKGCTSSRADNFMPAASIDDGSCTFIGCRDRSALNFDKAANISNGLCIYLKAGEPARPPSLSPARAPVASK